MSITLVLSIEDQKQFSDQQHEPSHWQKSVSFVLVH